MSLTLKQILDNVLLESGMATESVYATSTEPGVLRLVKLANRSAAKLSREVEWQALRKTHQFTLSTDTEYVLPEDYRSLIPDTTYTDSYIEGVDMRTSPSTWRYLQSNAGGTGPRYRMRILGDQIHVYQPNSGDDVTFEYLSNAPVLATNGTTYKERFTADNDTWLLDDDLLAMDIKWRYQKLLGLEGWQEDHIDFLDYKRTVQGQEAGAKTIVGNRSPGGYPEPYTDLWK